ncbi:hypothetical protein OG897_23080 [Streptomyces sp. NBC_00237]|uniref:hypothetical protein n=1 Tax=Streptomyces sp. NBC_00237 TaxID=2975687 RepID=UPI002253C2EC|nr:hypothetical protein [Streptomyces sp. NBC_00237]MCX5204324.1 hypothetical protein [Streptomyces sp. NBC_00237]
MNTFMDVLAVAFVFVLLALPSLIGHARDLRIDHQIRRAGEARAAEESRAHAQDGFGHAA